MLANAIAFFLSNIPGFMFAGAILVALVLKNPTYFPERLMNWLLLLSVGVMNLWAGLFHVFAPEMSARTIGWQDSPFHFEIGVSDIAIGIIAIASFWRSLEFKAAAIGALKLISSGIYDEVGLLSAAEIRSSRFTTEYLGPMDVQHGCDVFDHRN